VDLAEALEILAQPKRGARKSAEPLRELGPHPADAEPVVVMEGRYGPYVKHGGTNATLPKGTTPQTLTLEEAVRLLAEKEAAGGGKKSRRTGSRSGSAAARKPKGSKAAAPKKPTKSPSRRKT
jgi:DNA topoisomerase I